MRLRKAVPGTVWGWPGLLEGQASASDKPSLPPNAPTHKATALTDSKVERKIKCLAYSATFQLKPLPASETFIHKLFHSFRCSMDLMDESPLLPRPTSTAKQAHLFYSLIFWKNHLIPDFDRQRETIQITISEMIVFIFVVD